MLFAIQFAVVLLCILIGAQVGGIGLGVFGGIGLAVMAFGFHIQPTSPPIDVMLMIMAVVSAAAAMQAAGGLDYLVRVATRVLHRNPRRMSRTAERAVHIGTIRHDGERRNRLGGENAHMMKLHDAAPLNRNAVARELL